MKQIAIVEDEPLMREELETMLKKAGYETMEVCDFETAAEHLLQLSPDLILLDLMLPSLDGFQICRQLRSRLDIPIIMVTAKREDIDKIRGLGLGADDYVDKPFSPSVLVARVRSQLSRYQRLKGRPGGNTEISVRDVTLNTETHRCFVKGREIMLKNKEYEVLLFLMSNVDRVYTKEELYEKIWGFDAMGDNATVAVHINRLREKMEDDPAHPQYIQTVWGAGYRFSV